MHRLLTILLFAATCFAADDWYLFTSFRGNGGTGVFLALSPDGRNWTALNGNKPWLAPQRAGMLPGWGKAPTEPGTWSGPADGPARKPTAN